MSNEFLIPEMIVLECFLIPTTILLALLGALVSLPVLLPPIRKLSRGSVRARIAEIFVFGLLSFACGSVLLTWLNAAFVYGIGATMLSWTPEDFKQASPGAGVVIREDLQRNETDIINELWVRQLILPPWQQPCYTSQATVCDLADEVDLTATDNKEGWKEYLGRVGPGCFSALISAILVWLFTRRRGTAQPAHATGVKTL